MKSGLGRDYSGTQPASLHLSGQDTQHTYVRGRVSVDEIQQSVGLVVAVAALGVGALHALLVALKQVAHVHAVRGGREGGQDRDKLKLGG